MAELALDDQQRYAFAGHLDRVGLPQLMRREPSSNSGLGGCGVELRPDAGGCPWAAAGRAAEHAEQRAGRQRFPHAEPRVELLPRPPVHAEFPALAALAVTDQDGASIRVYVALVQRECFADSQTRSPEYDDEAAQSDRFGVIAGSMHHGDDLLDRRWVSRIVPPLVAMRSALVEAGQCRRRAPSAQVSSRVVDGIRPPSDEG